MSNLLKTLIILLLLLAILVVVLLGFHQCSREEERQKIVAITQIVRHPSLDAIRQGIVDELKPYNVNIVFDDAQGNVATAAQIAHKFVGMNPDVLVAITTPSAQTMAKADRIEKIALVFSAVTDPVAAGLVKDLAKPSKHITGTIDMPPIEKQVNLVLEIIPNIKTIGVVYNPSETNSVKQIESLREHAGDIVVLAIPATKTSEVKGAALNVVNQIDAFYVTNDNAIVSAIESLVSVSREHNIPVFASDPQSVSRGVTAALANNQYDVGRQTGKLITTILQGANPGDLAVVAGKKVELSINMSAAKAIGLEIPEHILNRADEIIE